MSVLAAGLLMGLLYVAAPGPLNAATLVRGLRGGFWMGLMVQIGALMGEMLCASLVLVLGAHVSEHSAVYVLLGFVGMIFLAVLGIQALREAARQSVFPGTWVPTSTAFRVGIGGDRARCAATGVTLALLNPFAIAFWISMSGVLIHLALDDRGVWLIGFTLGLVLWAPVLPALAARSRRAFGPRVLRGLTAANGLALLAGGLYLGHGLLAVIG